MATIISGGSSITATINDTQLVNMKFVKKLNELYVTDRKQFDRIATLTGYDDVFYISLVLSDLYLKKKRETEIIGKIFELIGLDKNNPDYTKFP